MRWFVVISAKPSTAGEKELVEILDGPFSDRYAADVAALSHARDGEERPYARKRYLPKRPAWVPIYGPRYAEREPGAV